MEKPRHRTVVTSDVHQQIVAMNRKAREEWNKKQGDSEKSQGVIDVSLFVICLISLMYHGRVGFNYGKL